MASGPPGDADGVTIGDAVSLGGALDGLAGTDGLAVGGSLGDTSNVGLAEAPGVASVAVGTLGVSVDVTPQAAQPTARRKRTIGRRTSVTPGRNRCTG